MLQTVEQVRSIIKGIKKAEALLALHLSHTPVISNSQELQAYIRTKLRMEKIIRRSRNKLQASDAEALKGQLNNNWFERDNIQAECH